MLNNKVNLCEISKDGLTPYEICAAKWNIHTLKSLIISIEKNDSEELDKPINEFKDYFFSINSFKKGLLLAIEEGKLIENKDLSMLDMIINQIKIQYFVDISENFF